MKKLILHLKGTLLGFDKETDSASESADGSGVGASRSVDTNPGPAIPPNDKTAFSSTTHIREGDLQVHPKNCTISTKFCTKVNNFALDSATVHASHQILGHPMHYCILP
jgi:hypothetical protein